MIGFRTVMINSNPETVSTDYDTSDLLFFEPLTTSDVMRVTRAIGGPGTSRGYRAIRGQTPLNLSAGLKRAPPTNHRYAAGVDRPRRGPRRFRTS